MRFRKPRPTSSPPGSLFSSQLRVARDFIQRRDFPAGLSELDTLSASAPNNDAQGRILALTADSQFKQGNFADALTAYSQAETLVKGQTRDWLRPVVGQVRSLLKMGDSVGALTSAQTALKKAVSLEAESGTKPTTGTVNPRPWRPAIVGTRLAKAFLLEGELISAQNLLAQVLLLDPKGSVVAQLVLAEMALRSGDFAGAAAQAKQAMLAGACRAKTLAGWSLFMQAAKAAGSDPYDSALLSSLATASPGVQARARVLIVRTLRSQGDVRWQGVAQSFLASAAGVNVRAAAEMRKMMASGTPTLINGTSLAQEQTAAQALLATPSLSPQEWLSAVKKNVYATLLSNQSVDALGLIAEGTALYGAPLRMRLAHSLAQVAVRAGQIDLARQLFGQNLLKTIVPGTMWGKSTWALARLEEGQGQFAQAAQLYWGYSQVLKMPSRWRLYAQVAWARNLVKAGQPDSILAAQQPFLAAINQVQDYELVLDVARQLTLAPPALNVLAQQVRSRGEILANQALNGAQHPAVALTILFKLTRRQNDFAEYAAIVASWEQLSTENRNWLWTPKGTWWEYLALVFRAYENTGHGDKAVTLATTFLNDAATPAEGVAILGVTYALSLLAGGQFTQAMSRFNQAITLSPTHPMCAYGYYWLGLVAWKHGDANGVAHNAAAIQAAISTNPGLSWQTELDKRAILLSAGLQANLIPAGKTPYTPSEFATTLLAMQADLESVV